MAASGLSPRGIPGHGTGTVCVDSDEHTEDGRITEDLDGVRIPMVDKRMGKFDLLREAALPPELVGDLNSTTLVVGWGSTYGATQAAARVVRAMGRQVAQAHLRHLNPFPPNLGEVLRSYERVLVPEVNLGQLRRLVRAEYLVDAEGLNKVNGLPFRRIEVQEAILQVLGSLAGGGGDENGGGIGNGNGSGTAKLTEGSR